MPGFLERLILRRPQIDKALQRTLILMLSVEEK